MRYVVVWGGIALLTLAAFCATQAVTGWLR
jgi:glycine/D-amino acid oxidase-like deaminating enzyme